MDAIGNISAVVIPRQPASGAGAPVVALPKPDSQPVLPRNTTSDNQAAEPNKPLIKLADSIANPHILGNDTVIVYTGADGKLITRYKNKEDGKVVYIPEPSLYQISGNSSASSTSSTLKIIA